MRRRVRRIKIRGEKWRIVIARPPQNFCDALCCYNERTIYIRPTADLTRCVVHEILHAACPDLSEEAVEELEDAICTGLEICAAMQ